MNMIPRFIYVDCEKDRKIPINIEDIVTVLPHYNQYLKSVKTIVEIRGLKHGIQTLTPLAVVCIRITAEQRAALEGTLPRPTP